LIVHDIACPNFTIGHSFKVQVNQPPMPDLRLDRLAGCAPLTLNYDTQVWDESFTTTFEFSATEIIQRDSAFTYSLKEPGTYNVKVYTKGRNGCSGIYELPYPLEVYPNPGVDVYWSPETPTTNDLITFYPTFKSEPITYMSWSFLGGVTPGDTTMNNATGMSDTTNVENPNRIYNQLGTYPVMLICKNEGECVDTVVKFVKVIDELQIFVPNSFTPNGDGINDVFMAKGSGMKLENFTMDIFSRAGQIVFTTKDINEGWNGKVGGQLAKDATYIYLIRVVGLNGEGRREYTGYVNLLK
jgi:gliding motility-associated-like protein